MEKKDTITKKSSRKVVEGKSQVTTKRASKPLGLGIAGTSGNFEPNHDINLTNVVEVIKILAKKQVIDMLYGNENLNLPIFRTLSDFTQLPIKTLSELVFEITPKTFRTYKEDGKRIPKHIIEKSIKLDELYLKGIELFGSVDKFNDWMKKGSYGLGYRVPLDLISTVTGIDLIYDELTKIEFGTTA